MVLETQRIVVERVVLTMAAGMQDMVAEWFDKAEHAELRESGS